MVTGDQHKILHVFLDVPSFYIYDLEEIKTFMFNYYV